MKYMAFFVSGFLSTSLAYAGFSPTPFTAKIINNTGKPLILTQGSLPNSTHAHPSNPMFCPGFAATNNVEQPLNWALNGSLFPAHIQSVDLETHFYAQAGGTSSSHQSDFCVGLKNAQRPQLANQITCDPEPYVKYGGIKFSAYNGGIVTVSDLKKTANGYTAKCTLNTYTYLNRPPPYRVLNVGQNYVPAGQPSRSANTTALATRTTPILTLNHYMNNFNGTKPMPLHYAFSGNADVLSKTNEALLQEKNNQLFVQHNVPYSLFKAYYNASATSASSGCRTGGKTCTPLLSPTGKVVKNKFVLWSTIQTTVNPGPTAIGHEMVVNEAFPLVISNAIRAKTVSELVNQRMLALVMSKKIPDTRKKLLAGSWLTKSGLPNQAEIAPNADPVQSDIRDYLAISANRKDLAVGKVINIVPLRQYYVLPHTGPNTFLSETHITYTLDASNMTLNADALKAYGIAAAQTTIKDPVVHLSAIDQKKRLPGSVPQTASGQSLGFQQAATADLRFQVGLCSKGQWSTGVKPAQGQVCLQAVALKALAANDDGVYQINTRAYNQESNNSAFATFYVYLNNTTPNLASWNVGKLPSFNVLQYTPGQKFSTAYLYTSYDFTKSYEQSQWKKSIGTLLNDLSIANTKYQSGVKAAFIDVNNISFQNNEGYWPVVEGSRYASGDLLGSIQQSGLQTNLDPTLLSGLMDWFQSEKTKTGINPILTIYPANNLKAGFAGFNPQQRQYFVDLSVAPVLWTNGSGVSPVSGISVDFEGGLNSVGDTQFYKLLSDKLAYRGKWFSYFYFSTLVTPAFVESIGPLGALEVSTYDVGTYRTPSKPVENLTENGASYPPVTIPNTVPLQDQGYDQTSVDTLYQNVFSQDKTCDLVSLVPTKNPTNYQLTSISWCNNSPNQSYSENTRMWNSYVKNTFQYASPALTMQYFHGKFHLVLPTSWSATQWTNLYVWNPDLTAPFSGGFNSPVSASGGGWSSGLFMVYNGDGGKACQAAKLEQNDSNLSTCLLRNQEVGKNAVPVQAFTVNPDGLKGVLSVTGLPGTVNQNGSWSAIDRVTQMDFMQTNLSVYKSFYHSPNLVGLGAYALELYEAVPSAVKSVVVNGANTPNAALQLPWYVGFTPDTIPGTALSPGYDKDLPAQIWTQFGTLMKAIGD